MRWTSGAVDAEAHPEGRDNIFPIFTFDEGGMDPPLRRRACLLGQSRQDQPVRPGQAHPPLSVAAALAP